MGIAIFSFFCALDPRGVCAQRTHSTHSTHFRGRNWGILGQLAILLPIKTMCRTQTNVQPSPSKSQNSEKHMHMACVGTPSLTAPKVGKVSSGAQDASFDIARRRTHQGADHPSHCSMKCASQSHSRPGTCDLGKHDCGYPVHVYGPVQTLCTARSTPPPTNYLCRAPNGFCCINAYTTISRGRELLKIFQLRK